MLHGCCRSNISSTTLEDPLTCTHGPKVEEEHGRRAIGLARHVTKGARPLFFVVAGARDSTHPHSLRGDVGACGGLQRVRPAEGGRRRGGYAQCGQGAARGLHASRPGVSAEQRDQPGGGEEEEEQQQENESPSAGTRLSLCVYVCAGQQGSRVEPEIL